MFTAYSYNSKDADFNNIIDTAIKLTKESYEGISNPNRTEEVKVLNAAICKYALQGTRYETLENASLKNPQINKDPIVRSNFDAIVAEIINASAPAVASADYSKFLAEVTQVGWGETARFLVKSNDLFRVNEIAEGVTRGILQPIYNDEITVNCGKIQIATAIDWYQVAAGSFDWGDLGYKISKSFEGYIFLKVVAAMTSAASQLGAAYTAGPTFTDAAWINLIQRVGAANGGDVAVYGIGTLAALNKIVPSVPGFQYGLGKEIADKGFLDKYLGAKLIPVDQAIVPGTLNTTADFAVPNDKIYVIAAAKDKPAKIVFEGGSIVIENIPEETTDYKYGISISMRIGTAALVGSKFGIYSLS